MCDYYSAFWQFTCYSLIMALNINGTTRISGVDGSASAPAVTGTDSNTGINFASDTVNINTGGSTRATVDSSGRLLLGTTTEGLGGADQLTLSGSGDSGMTIRSGTSSTGSIYFSDGTSGADEYRGVVNYNHASNFMRFYTNASERIRVDSSGNVGIGTSSPSSSYQTTITESDTGNGCLKLDRTSNIDGTLRSMVSFERSGTAVGTILCSNSATQYNTSSDHRLKENVVTMSNATDRLKQLQPKRFNFIINPDTTVDGFLAHEVQSGVPEAISGTKDETQDILYTEEDTIPSGKKVGDVKETVPKYQGIDQSKLVPLLTAALQEAIAKIEVLETKVAALEAG